MLATWQIISLVILGAETLIGISINTFMVVVNLKDWAIGRSLNSVDIILLLIGLLNIVSESTICLYKFLIFLCRGFQGLELNVWTFGSLMLFLGYTMFWFSTCLSVFYCMKIVRFKAHLLVRFKLKLPVVLRHLLIVGPVIFLILTIPELNLLENTGHKQAVEDNRTASDAIKGYWQGWRRYYMLTATTVGFCLPFVLGVTASGLIITSLRRHKRYMEKNCSGFSKPNLNAHLKAAKLVLSQLIIYVVFFVFAMLIRFNNLPPDSAESMCCWMVIHSCGYLSSIFLILGNSKLRQALKRMLGTNKTMPKSHTTVIHVHQFPVADSAGEKQTRII